MVSGSLAGQFGQSEWATLSLDPRAPFLPSFLPSITSLTAHRPNGRHADFVLSGSKRQR
ncbi:unnamed protein product [Citrullus colocynthis]|uniref:Uncharacterized protein n=1 Tax=Citrullus colocynthis TaxID=252529 RepID=A0ABP0YLD9_9ROSI